MKKIIFLVLFLCLSSLHAISFFDFDSYQNQLTHDEVQYKIQRFLEKDSSIQRFYHLTAESLTIGDLENNHIDYILHLSSSSKKKPDFSSGLKGKKIALDPGHFGGIYSKLEDRYIFIQADKINCDHSISFDEGTLTFLTALELKEALQNEGAIVFLTRPNIGQGAVRDDFLNG